MSQEDELLRVKYRIEKSGMRQQRMEDHLLSLSKELRQSKRNSLFYMLFFLIAFLGLGITAYFINNKSNIHLNTKHHGGVPEDLKLINDSLQKELTRLKSDMEKYKSDITETKDSLSQENDSIRGKKNDELKFERVYAYVESVYRKDGVVFIEADYIEYFEGKKAVEKARENGEAEYDVDKEGDTLYFLYDNYYIRNVRSKIKILELDDKVSIANLNQISKGFPIKAFKKIIKDHPVMILEVNNGIVYKVTKQLLP